MEPQAKSLQSQQKALLCAEIAAEAAYAGETGRTAVATVGAKFATLFTECLRQNSGHEYEEAGAGHLALFDNASDALRCALAFQKRLDAHGFPDPSGLRVGIHAAELVTAPDGPGGDQGLPDQAVEIAVTVKDLARRGQILLTRKPFDAARQDVISALDGSPLEWLAHGSYLLASVDEPVEVFEVGVRGDSATDCPADSSKARRDVSIAEESVLGWRPAAGLRVPGRNQWILERMLGEGGFGEVWVAREETNEETRAFKFCFRAERLRALKREMTLFRLITESLGERPDIARLYGVQLDEAPYYLELEYTEGGDLAAWAKGRGGIGKIRLAERLEIVAQVAEALDAANSIGILHKDVKPTNVLIDAGTNGAVQPKLTDFGIGQLVERERLKAMGIEGSGFTSRPSTLQTELSSRSGTRIYFAPELQAGKPPSVQSDVYALGILLYQVVVGDLVRPLGHGWEREIEDELLREDIGACVDVEPERRLRSAGELALRLRRLAERRAERETARRAELEAVRARKRRRTLVVVSIASLVLVAVASLFAVRENLRAREEERLRGVADAERRVAETERQRADQEARSAERVVSFLLNIFNDSSPDRRGEEGPSGREILDRGVERIETELDEEPLIKARVLTTVASVYYSLGFSGEALRLAESARDIVESDPSIPLRDRIEVLSAHLNSTLRVDPKPDTTSEEARLLQLARELREVSPRDPYALSLVADALGRAAGNRGDYDRAIEKFGEAIRLQPENANYYRLRARAYQEKGDHEREHEDLTEVLRIKPESAMVQNELAWRLVRTPEQRLRDPARAVELAQKAVELAPTETNYWGTLGTARLYAKDWEGAIAAVEKAMELGSGGSSYDWFILAMAHWELGAKEEARAWQNKAVTWMDTNLPQNSNLIHFRAEAEELMGPSTAGTSE